MPISIWVMTKRKRIYKNRPHSWNSLVNKHLHLRYTWTNPNPTRMEVMEELNRLIPFPFNTCWPQMWPHLVGKWPETHLFSFLASLQSSQACSLKLITRCFEAHHQLSSKTLPRNESRKVPKTEANRHTRNIVRKGSYESKEGIRSTEEEGWRRE